MIAGQVEKGTSTAEVEDPPVVSPGTIVPKGRGIGMVLSSIFRVEITEMTGDFSTVLLLPHCET